MVSAWLWRVLEAMVLKERSVTILAASFAAGAFIAFSPYIFFHTVLVILFSWLFSLNFLVVLATSNLINNPWTMVPVYMTDYAVGEWLLSGVFGINTLALNPCWMCTFNDRIQTYTGISGLSFWSFMVGGNILGVVVALVLYSPMKYVFNRLVYQIYGQQKN